MQSTEGGETRGAQGPECAPPVFLVKLKKILDELIPLFDLNAIMHLQFLAPCAISDFQTHLVKAVHLCSIACHFIADRILKNHCVTRDEKLT